MSAALHVEISTTVGLDLLLRLAPYLTPPTQSAAGARRIAYLG
jgi:hypothetical protein